MSHSESPPDESWTMIEQSVHRVFTEATAHGHDHVVLGRRLDELGWADIEADFPAAATQLLFRARALTLAQTDCLDRVALGALGSVLTGPVDSVVWPAPGEEHSGHPEQIDGIVIGPAHGRLVVALAHESGQVSVGVVEADQLLCEPMNTFDAASTWTRVTGTMREPMTDGTDAWRDAVATARRALGTELVTLAEQMLTKAVEHVGSRTQFGAPIGSFQAPRHALAHTCARLEGARAVVDEAWRHGDDLSALMAKAVAGRVHREVTDVTIQASGAIGLTIEHDLHRYVARGMQLDALLGGYRHLESALAERLLSASGRAEPLPAVVTCA